MQSNIHLALSIDFVVVLVGDVLTGAGRDWLLFAADDAHCSHSAVHYRLLLHQSCSKSRYR